MSEIIELTDSLRIRRLDERNVTVEKLSENGNWNQANGDGRGPYCRDEPEACDWVLKHGVMDEAGETDLQGALKEYRRVASKLERAVKAALS